MLNLLGVVSATALACNFHGVITERASPWWRGDADALAFLVFLALLGGLIVLFHVIVRKLTDLIKWERLHWTVQGIGLVLGGVRGLWWAGLVLRVFLALGVPYLKQSIEERSLLAPRLMPLTTPSIEWVADRYPGHMNRLTLIPSMTLQLPKFPEL